MQTGVSRLGTTSSPPFGCHGDETSLGGNKGRKKVNTDTDCNLSELSLAAITVHYLTSGDQDNVSLQLPKETFLPL